jgi:hypothetical protein
MKNKVSNDSAAFAKVLAASSAQGRATKPKSAQSSSKRNVGGGGIMKPVAKPGKSKK